MHAWYTDTYSYARSTYIGGDDQRKGLCMHENKPSNMISFHQFV